MSPRHESVGCDLYFGLAAEGALPPPYGSGTIVVYDYMQNMFVATYTPTSFTVAAGDCTYYFSGPKINTESGRGVAKIVLDGSLAGAECPPADDPASCHQSYWVTGNGATGVFGFVDAGRGPCPALFAVADQGSTPLRGTLLIIGAAHSQEVMWVPSGYNVSYDGEAQTIAMQTPGCHGAYKIDPTSYGGGGASGEGGLSFPQSGGPPPTPGSATMEFHSVSPSTCNVTCKGYNAIWDAQGPRPVSPRRARSRAPDTPPNALGARPALCCTRPF
jgi:hypothetical protein